MKNFLLLVWLLGACVVVHDDVEALLARGQGEQALRKLAQDEAFLAHQAPSEQARHGLLRGLAHLSLGDRQTARWWLFQARAVVDREPEALSPLDRARLLDALHSLDGPLPSRWLH
ncbi:MAG: hypothetical protein RMJ98_04215 [Myxococcales bacterium]|nr:hypothetical protein [Polyangiaceae bacterium]MDW8248495.1 hypothetical protein [Myxococcales bacterium]